MTRNVRSLAMGGIFTLFFIPVLPAHAQQVRILPDDEWCDRSYGYRDDAETYCEVREITLSETRDLITVDGERNGGISIIGWDRNEIQIRAKVQAHARHYDEAADLAQEVHIETGRTIYARVPRTGSKERAYVSFEVYVPYRSNLSLDTYNGGISIEDVSGEITFEAHNGGVHLAGVGGDVRGATRNGGLHVELTGSSWSGRGLDVETKNGGVKINVPEDYSARLQTRTVNGQVRVDFPITVRGRIGREIDTELGSGGATVRVVTTNGGVVIEQG